MTSGKRLTKEEREQAAVLKKERDRAYFKKYYEAHKEKIAQQHKEWANNNREKMREYSKRFYGYKTSATSRRAARLRYRNIVGEKNIKKDLCRDWRSRNILKYKVQPTKKSIDF